MYTKTQATKTALIEALKEFGRLLIFGAIGGIIAALAASVNLLPEPWMQVAAASLIATIAKAWDKFIHKDENISANGLLPF